MATNTFSWNVENEEGLFDFSGAIAPTLPAYDNATYPCATIIMDGTYDDQPMYYLCLHNGYNHAGTHVVEFTEPMIVYSYVCGSETWVSQEVNKSSFDTMELIWSNTSYTNTDEYGSTVDITAESPTPLDSYNLLFGPTSVPSDADTFQYGNYTMYKVSEELLPVGISHAIITIIGAVVDSFTMPATVIGNSQAFTEGGIALVISVDEDDLSTFGAPSQGLYFMDASFCHINCCAYKVESTSGGYFPVPEVYVPYVNTAEKIYEVWDGSTEISWNGDITGHTTTEVTITDSNGQAITYKIVKISNMTPDFVGATISGTFQGNSVSNRIVSSDMIISDGGVYAVESSDVGSVIVATYDGASMEGITFPEKGTYVAYQASVSVASISMWSDITISIPSSGAKPTYSHIAVAENQNYISVHFLTDDFNLVTYDPETTIYTAQGIAFVTYDKRTDKWSAEVVDNTTTPSEGSRYLNHWVWSDVDVTWNGATVFTNQEGWYYNSVKLPNIISECGAYDDSGVFHTMAEAGYDLGSYPYRIMYYVDVTALGEGCYAYVIYYSTAPYSMGRNTEGSYINAIWCSPAYAEKLSSISGINLTSDAWIGQGIGEHSESDAFVLDETSGISWTSHDILNTDGTLYLSASEPVHVTYVVEEDPDDPNDPDDPDKSSYDELSFKIGLVFGLCGKGIPKGLLLFDGDGYMLNWYSKDGFIETVESDGKYWGKISNTIPLLDGNTLLEMFVDGNILVSESGTFTEIEDNWYRHATTLVYVATGTNSKNLSTGIWYLSDNNIPTEGYHIRMSKE